MGNKRVVTANRKDFIMKKDVLVGVKYNITELPPFADFQK